MRILVAASLVMMAGLAAAGCSNSSPAQEVAPGSAVLPCSQIHDEVRAILPYYRANSPEDHGQLYGMETALAAKFGNVSNLDSPQNLASAEVNFELAVQDGHLTQNQPFSAEVDQAIHPLAAACGIQESYSGISG